MNKNQEIKNFVVVGAGSPVGYAIARRIMLNQNYNLMMTTRKEYASCTEILQKNTDRVRYLMKMDLSDRKKLLGEFKENVADFVGNEPYAVIMSTSYFPEHKPFIETSFEEADEIWKANLEVPRDIMRCLIPHMLDHKGGHFIGFSCQSTKSHYPYMGDFTASKDALEGYMQTLAQEHATHGVKFNTVRLASVYTDFTIKSKPNGDTKNYIKPKKVSRKVMGIIRDRDVNAQSGESQDAFEFSPVDHSRKGYADRIRTKVNGPYLDAILDWKPGDGPFPRREHFYVLKPQP